MGARPSSSVVVLGSANVDLVVDVARRPAPGETVLADGYRLASGGKGANQAVAAARVGAETAFVGCIGADPWGAWVREQLAAAGVEPVLRTVEDARTGAAFITVTADGENSIVVAAGANARLAPADAEAARGLIERADALCVQLEVPVATVRRACELARAAGTLVVLTPAPVSAEAAGLLELADVVVPNEGEARALAGEGEAEELARRLAAGGATAVVTRGARGAVVAVAGREPFAVPAPSYGDAVDTTGAGDALAGVLAAQLGAGRALEDAAATAVAAASLSVTRLGAQPSLPTLAEP